MALATRCPACTTVFRISTAQAAAKGGMVRCGQCHEVFNSLDALVRVEDLDVLGEREVAAPDAAALLDGFDPAAHGPRSEGRSDARPDAPLYAPPDAPPDAPADTPLEASPDAPLDGPAEAPPAAPRDVPPGALPEALPQATSEAPPEEPDEPPEAARTTSEAPPADQDAASAVGDRMPPAPGPDARLSGDPAEPGDSAPAQPVIAEWWLPETGASVAGVDPDEASGAPGRSADAAQPDDAVLGERLDEGMLLSGRRTDLRIPGSALGGTSPTFMHPEAPVASRGRATRWVFSALALLALMALVGQAAYLWRDELAAHWSPARRWLSAACGPLQCVVDFPAHPDAISIESASIQASGPNLDVYVLTALLRNRESIDVRYPHLELVLTDVQDRPILRRALRPEDYLPAGRGTSAAGFPAQSELPLRVTFELNDLRFAGYRLDRFYP